MLLQKTPKTISAPQPLTASKPLDRRMRKFSYILVLKSSQAFGQSPSKTIDIWTEKVPFKLVDFSLSYTDKNITLYFDKAEIVQLIDVITIN